MTKLTPEQIEKCKRLSKNLQPLTITITDPEDAMKLVSVFMYAMGGGVEGGEVMASTLGMVCKQLGVEEGVEIWLQAAKESGRAKNIPTFYKPLLIYYFGHVMRENEKEKAKQ